MSEVVLEVENISKLYRLGTIGSGSFRQDMKRWWMTNIVKKEDPFFGPTSETASNSNSFLWALDDVSFTLREGDSLGIIGSNGAGKSTLLKIISRIVQPTKGMVRGVGKVAS